MAINLWDYESGAPYKGDYKKTLNELQERVAELFVANLLYRRKAIIVCEGWDAAGKGGSIQRLTSQCDPRTYKVWPIAAPNAEEKGHHYLWRFWRRLPSAGEVAVFDRSWYGRVLVERVEDFATTAEWKRAYDEINEFEALQTADGAVIVKLFYHVTAETQDERFRARLEHPWKRWKITAEDVRNRGRRKEYLEAIKDMFEETDTRWAPWKVIDGNDKNAARISTLTIVADALAAALPRDPPTVSPEMKQLEKQLMQKRD